MRASRFLEKPETARVLLRFLLHWLAFHILDSDMQAARQIERLGRDCFIMLRFFRQASA